MKSKFFIVIVIVITFITVGFISKHFKIPGRMGIIESQTMDMTVKPPEGAMPVETETIKPTMFSSSITYTGTVVAYNDTPIIARVSGIIVNLPVYPGDKIKKGQLLVKLDDKEISSRLNESKFGENAAFKNYQGLIKQKEQALSMINKSKAVIKSTKADFNYWRNQINRSNNLFKEGVISIEELQEDKAKYEAAKASYYQAKADYEGANKFFEAAQMQSEEGLYQSKQAQSATNTQRIIKNYTVITSPINGVVSERILSEGTLASDGAQILKISQIDPIRIQANVAMADLASIKKGMDVIISSVKGNKETRIKAKLTSIFPSLDLKTRTAVVEAVIPNQNNIFSPGEYIKMNIVTEKAEPKITVPLSSIVKINQQEAIWAMVKGRAVIKYVTTGSNNGERVEIIEGLNTGDVIITKRNEELEQDMAVIDSSKGLDAIASPILSNRMTKDNNYKITTSLDKGKIEIKLPKNPPVVGDNEFAITYLSNDNKISDGLMLEMSELMPSMPDMYFVKPKVKNLGKGEFKAIVNLSMPGLWEITVILKDNNKVISTNKYEIEVP